MPKFLEEKLEKEYPGNPGAVYGTMNKLGFMHGNKETHKGKVAEKKHEMAKKMHKTMDSARKEHSESASGHHRKHGSGYPTRLPF